MVTYLLKNLTIYRLLNLHQAISKLQGYLNFQKQVIKLNQ